MGPLAGRSVVLRHHYPSWGAGFLPPRLEPLIRGWPPPSLAGQAAGSLSCLPDLQDRCRPPSRGGFLAPHSLHRSPLTFAPLPGWAPTPRTPLCPGVCCGPQSRLRALQGLGAVSPWACSSCPLDLDVAPCPGPCRDCWCPCAQTSPPHLTLDPWPHVHLCPQDVARGEPTTAT